MSVPRSSAAGVWTLLYVSMSCVATQHHRHQKPFPNVVVVVRKRVAARGDDVDGDSEVRRKEEGREIERKLRGRRRGLFPLMSRNVTWDSVICM